MHRPTQRLAIALFLCLAPFAHSQAVAKPTRISATPQEQRAIRAFDAAKMNPLELTAFLVNMPKGGDKYIATSWMLFRRRAAAG